MRSHAAVVVIGGGAVGTSCLYHLALAGVKDCVLIEKDELTSGSTWHAAGNIPTYATSWLGMRAGNYAWRLYKELADVVDYPITYRHTGAFWPAHTRDRMDFFHHLVGVSKSAGFELSMLTPAEMEQMHPFYDASESVIGGILDPYEGDLDPSQLTQALANGAREHGAAIERFTQVLSIDTTRQGEWRVVTDKGEIVCENVVNATGFYGARIAGYVGSHAPIQTLEHQYLVTESIDALKENDSMFPLVRDPDVRFYLRRERDALLFGSYAHPGRPAFDDGLPEQFSQQLFADSVDDIAEVLSDAVRHVPLLGEAGVQRFVNGPIAYTPDALPLCGPVGGLSNFYHACGIQVGILQSAAVGKAISEWITVGETEWDLSSWDPRRFGDWATPEYTRARTIELYDLQYAIPYPHRILTSGRPVRQTPLHDTLSSRGAVFGEVGGWERAMWFDRRIGEHPQHLSFRDDEPWRDAVREECEAVRDAVGVMDHGGFTKYEVEGVGAGHFLSRVFCSSMPDVGRVRLCYMLTPQGRLWSEATIARLSGQKFLLCGPTLAIQRDFDLLTQHLPEDGSVRLQKGTERDAALMVMGPASRELLSTLTTADLGAAAMPWMSVHEIHLAGKQLTAMRVSYVGELGWELHLPSAHLPGVYEAVSQAGAELGLRDFGSYALNAMRLEKGYHAWGVDFGSEYTVSDAGLERFVRSADDDFIGADAVRRVDSAQTQWQFCAFTVEGSEADPLASDPILHRGELAGYVTSGGTGFRVGKRIAMGYLKRECAEFEADYEIEIFGQRCRATRCRMPIYDPGNTRLKS